MYILCTYVKPGHERAVCEKLLTVKHLSTKVHRGGDRVDHSLEYYVFSLCC